MTALITLFICCAAVVLLAAVYIWRRRGRRASRASGSACAAACGAGGLRGRRGVVGSGPGAIRCRSARARSLVVGAADVLEAGGLGRVTAFAVAWLASRGRGAAAMSLKPPSAQGARNAGPMDSHNDQTGHDDMSSHGDSTDHSDIHSDGGGDQLHTDSHSDGGGGHTDTTPHNDNPTHFDM